MFSREKVACEACGAGKLLIISDLHRTLDPCRSVQSVHMDSVHRLDGHRTTATFGNPLKSNKATGTPGDPVEVSRHHPR